MSNKPARVKALYNARYIRKIGIVKYLIVCCTMLFAQEEYEVRWKGKHLHLRKHTSDLVVFKQVMVFDQYNYKLTDKSSIKTIVDLGANIGLSTLQFRMRYPDAKIIAVEPEKNNYDLLVKNTAGEKNIHCLNNAIWSSKKGLSLYDQGLGEYAYIVREEPTEAIEQVQALTMNDIIDQFNIKKIDLLKIDIEGSEKELFASNFESWLPYVDRIMIELHDWYRPGCASSFFRAISGSDYTMQAKGETLMIQFDKKPVAVAYS